MGDGLARKLCSGLRSVTDRLSNPAWILDYSESEP